MSMLIKFTSIMKNKEGFLLKKKVKAEMLDRFISQQYVWLKIFEIKLLQTFYQSKSNQMLISIVTRCCYLENLKLND